ncbi:hypothetical protein ASF49_19845 [Methylobacterium sp. Leaf104]|uniref:hypothetical protein n=1 Tax=Methylobacterium TaxID=407 RepID=UPI0006F3BDEE|nr:MULTISPECIES: hypothetical protein [Methylobacterium]KQP40933.1 hypothetical protein ASF49_19845 [Methylobacterium sp. Leaf104]MCI9880855.1 hypothetical protein [Methylobacterium goesingense]
MSRRLTYALLAAGALVLVLAALPFVLLLGIMTAGEDRIGTVRDAATADLPGLRLTLERRFAHPFLAEYHRSLTATQDQGGATRIDLGMDTGGLTRVTVCRTGTGTLLVHDAWATYALAPGPTRPTLTPEPAATDPCPTPLGAFDVDGQKDLGFRARS